MNIFNILLAILIIIDSGLLLGFLVGYIVLRIQKKPWPFSRPFARRRSSHVSTNIPARFPLEKQALLITGILEPAVPTGGPFFKPGNKEFCSGSVSLPTDIPKTELVLEIENNLSTAKASRHGTLRAFRTQALDPQKGQVDSLHPELQKVISVAYKDMRLANTLVGLSKPDSELHDDKFLYNSYVGLCSRIAENLEQAIVSLINSAREEPESK